MIRPWFLRKLFGLYKTSRRPAVPFRPRLEGLEERQVPTTVDVYSGQSIQAAINAASSSGDTIRVHPGTYTEQLTITKNNLTLTTTGPDATIQAPATFSGPSRAIIDINGATGVVINDFTITAGSNGPAQIDAGIQLEGGASATITNNHITHIQDSLAANLGNPDGVGVLVGRSAFSPAAGLTSGPTTGSASIRNNRIDSYQKDGIVIAGAVGSIASSGNINDNIIVGVGPSSANPGGVSGVEISFGATGTVAGNTITANVNPTNHTSSDVLVYQAGNNVLVEENLLVHANVGVWFIDTNYGTIEENIVVATDTFGIGLDFVNGGSNHNLVTQNAVFRNSGDGIDLFGSSNNTISYNASFLNTGNGFTLDAGSTNNLLIGNVSAFNGGDGLLITNTGNTGNTIAFNLFFDNTGIANFEQTLGTSASNTGNTFTFNFIS
jgi:parallel beta-helix repeat protein